MMEIDPDSVMHRPSCSGAAVGAPFIGSRGDTLVQCRECKMLTVFKAAGSDDTTAQQRDIISRYVCPEHTHRAVNANGKGCGECATQRREWQRERQRRRDRRRQQPQQNISDEMFGQ